MLRKEHSAFGNAKLHASNECKHTSLAVPKKCLIVIRKLINSVLK